MEFVECYTLYSTLWKEVGWPPASLRPVPNYVSAPCPRRGLVAPKCVILNIVWYSPEFGAWVLFVNLVFYNLVDVWAFYFMVILMKIM
jgi:hypothetical protein